MGRVIIGMCLILTTLSLLLSVFAYNENYDLIEQLNRPLTNISSSVSITSDNFSVYENYTIINKPGLVWFGVADTNSMLPTIDSGHYGLGINVSSMSNITVGDVVIYKDLNNTPILHRVYNILNETHIITKGDNNKILDEPININQVEYKLVGIIY